MESGARLFDVAEKVRDFYDLHPYPPPIDNLERYRDRSDDRRRRGDALLFWPTEPFRDDRRVLVAGCGTSQAAKYAMRWPGAQVTGIDVSTTSIEHTERLKRRHHLDNLDIHQLPVERVGELACTFEHVICTGVLHHLSDPDAALQALREVLATGGAMHLMVYAPYGRAGIYLLQEYGRRLGIGTTEAEIRDLAASLQALPPDHPLVPLLRAAPDFRQESALADALLHPHDRSYSVPQFFDFIHRAGLRFGRWLRQAPYLPRCGALSSSPHQPLLRRLPIEDQYAAVELFRGTMARHSAVVHRNDPSTFLWYPRFDDDIWLEYVPVHVPDTVCVKERLPPGAAAVLINPCHTYTDIYLPINAQELRWFDAIDGQRRIREIATQDASRDAARSLFERLWWYDQVVFDASRAVGE